MGGGSRPWVGNAVKVKVVSVTGMQIVLEAYDDAPDLVVGSDYVAVFHNPPADQSAGDAPQPG